MLDEPTGELDPGASEQIFRLLRRMNEAHGMTVIVVEQKIMLLSAYAKKLAVLNDGQLELFGPVREVLRHSARLEAIGVHCPRVVTLSNRLADLTGGALAADLDYRECMEMMARVQALNAAGTTVVMVCHDMELVLDFAHRVLVLCEGALLLDGETRAVFRNEAVLRQASVLPPQITCLSLRLADCLPPADTAEEMEAAVRAARERRVPA